MSRRAGGELPQGPPRSWLFVPGAAERFVAKLGTVSPGARPDSVIFDLEDGVATGELSGARRRIASIAADPQAAPWLPASIAVRTHAVTHPAFDEDLLALGPRVTTLLLPKVDSAQEITAAAARLAAGGLPDVGIVAIIESAAGLEDASAIARSLPASVPTGGPGLQGVAFGAEDFAADLGLPPWTGVGHADVAGDAEAGRRAMLDAARARIVTAAASAGIAWRIDTPALRVGHGGQVGAVVEAEARRSRAMGFSGKFAIHPSHVEPLHQGFEPARSEVAWARAVLAGVSLARPDGAALVAGQMVDEALARQARAILSTRRLARKPAGEADEQDGETEVG